MRQNPISKHEAPAEDVERLRKHRFALRDLLTFVTTIPIGIGVITAVEFTAFNQSYEWFGIGWHSDVRHFLIDNVGVPSDFVTGYVSFAMIDLPAWVCYAAIALILGLIRSKWAFPIGIAFVISIFVWDLMSDYFSGLHLKINLRLVSLFGVVLAAVCFAVARRLRGRSHGTDRQPSRLYMGFTCLAIVATLAVSIYGWWLVGISRQEGREVQQWFTNIEIDTHPRPPGDLGH